MAMLAEPKRRHQSFALQPRGKPLYEDSTNFGSKMLSKMGWQPGKGLGANENGKLDFIKVKYKNDIQGIGFEARDDQWTQHEDGFNKLLQTLSNSNSQQNSDDDEDSRPMIGFATEENNTTNVYKPSGESLEQKSKISRTRVHYKKFTKGKDLSQYSEKDLANIFGKKVDSGDVASQTPPSEETTPVENTFVSSIFTTTSTLTLSDYFKMKMTSKNQADKTYEKAEPEIKEIQKPKKQKKKNKDAVINEIEEVVIEKKKKNKKQKDIPHVEPKEEETPIVEIEAQTKKKKKRKESKVIEETEPTVEMQTDDEQVKKSKKRKRQDVEPDVVVKKKKKKSKHSDPEEPVPINIQPNSLKQSEIEFNRVRAEQICNYLQNCQRMTAQTTLIIHPAVAELIRNANISGFKKSNISQIIGYGLTQDVGLDILKDVKINLGQLLRETVTAEDPHLIVF